MTLLIRSVIYVAIHNVMVITFLFFVKKSSLPDEWKSSEAIGSMCADFKALKEVCS